MDDLGPFWQWRDENPMSHKDVALSCMAFAFLAMLGAAGTVVGIIAIKAGASGGIPYTILAAVGAVFYWLKIFARIHLHWPKESP